MIRDIEELNFPSYATLSQASVNINDMEDMSITSQVKINGNISPDFSYDWEVMFKGERYIMPLRKPQGAKDNTKWDSEIDLTFQHWAIYELKRHFFVEITSVDSSTAIADKYEASLSLNLKNFIDALNLVLSYYYGNRIEAVLHPNWVYSEEQTVLTISYTKIWDLLLSVYKNYSVRWSIKTDDDGKCLLLFGFPTNEIDHVFEYGFRGGLLKVERQVQSDGVKNILLGRGGDKNIPYRYFKDIDSKNPSFSADPDWIPELANIHFSNLRDSAFRSYVQGWKAKHYGGEIKEAMSAVPWAYQRGYTDNKFQPVEYVKDDISIEKYGELWGALDNNDDVYPTIQGVTISPYGRIDEIVDVEEIQSDEINDVESDFEIKSLANMGYITTNVNGEGTTKKSRRGQYFTVPSGKKANLLIGSTSYQAYKRFDMDVSMDLYVIVKTDVMAIDSNGQKVPASGLSEGRYEVYIEYTIENSSKDTVTVKLANFDNSLEMSSVSGQTNNGTFSVWVKNIWGTSFNDNETEEDYAKRVWEPILGDREEQTAKIVFADGFLGISEDYEFTIIGMPVYDTSKSIDGVSSLWRITLAKSDAELDATGLLLPNTQINAKPGDHFFFIGIDLPYLYYTEAEKRLTTIKQDELDKISEIRPTWVVSTDPIRLNNLQEGELKPLVDEILVGSKVQLADKRFISTKNEQGEIVPDVPELLYVKSITYTYREPTSNDAALNPDIEIVLSDDYSVVENPVSLLQGEVSELQKQVGSLSNIEQVVQSVGRKIFLEKDKRDRTPFRLGIGDKFTAERGIQVGENFVPGTLTGRGGYIDKDANAELESLILRRFLDVPEIRFNRTRIESGDSWNAPGMGILERVEPDINTDGSLRTSGTGYLKLEEGEYGEIAVGDICMGIFHSGTPNENSAINYDDGKGNFLYAGFYTSYFTISSVFGLHNEKFRYQLRPISSAWETSYHPSAAMHFVSYGSFTDPYRQTSQYSTRTYTRLLWKQKTWEIGIDNIAMQWGDLTNMSVHGKDMQAYSAYLNSVYFTGTIERVKPDGTIERTANDRGAWEQGQRYDYYDRVSHDGSLWLCVSEDGTTSEPTSTNTDWLLQVAHGANGEQGNSYSDNLYLNTTYENGTANWRVFNQSKATLSSDGDVMSLAFSNAEVILYNKFVDVKAGEKFTLSGWIRADKDLTLNYNYLIYLDPPNQVFYKSNFVSDNAVTTEWKLFVLQFIATKDGQASPGFGISSVLDNLVQFKHLKWERGYNNSPVWTPASEEMVGKTSYLHIKYAPVENPTSTQMSDTPNTYIGTYTDFIQEDSSDPTEYTWARFRGEQGIQGCIMRHSEWAIGVTYRNDEQQTSGTRYVDIAMIRNDGSYDGWDVYKCNTTHTSDESSRPDIASTLWTKLSGVGPIFTSLIIAKNASIDFLQGNQLLIKKSDGTVSAGISGSDEGNKTRIWVGAPTPSNAPFRVDENGKMTATNAAITGEINAQSGKIGGFKIEGNSITTQRDGIISIGTETFKNEFRTITGTKKVAVQDGINTVIISERQFDFRENNKTTLVNAIPNSYNWQNIAVANNMQMDYYDVYSNTDVPNNYGFQFAMIGNGHICMNGIVEGMCYEEIEFSANNTIEWILPPMWGNRIIVNAGTYTNCGIVLPDYVSLASCYGHGFVRDTAWDATNEIYVGDAMTFRITIINRSGTPISIFGRTTEIPGISLSEKLPRLYNENGEETRTHISLKANKAIDIMLTHAKTKGDNRDHDGYYAAYVI